MPKLFILAGEASGDRIGAELMSGLRSEVSDLDICGVGGESMAGQGLGSLFPIDDLAVMGYRDVILRLPLLLWRARQVIQAILREKPDTVVLIDAQVFSKVVAKGVHKRGFTKPIVLYVAPAVWAWGADRAPKLAKLYDDILSVLPFEPLAMQRLGGPHTVYVGHPALARHPMRATQPASGPALLLPGSRSSEIRRHLPVMEQAATALLRRPEITELVIPTLTGRVGEISKIVSSWNVPVTIAANPGDRAAAFSDAMMALAVSGTVTLELALSGVPHILTYIAEPAQVRIFKSATTRFIGLPNIIADSEVVPELLFAGQGDPATLADAALKLLDPDAITLQCAAFEHIRETMEKGAPEAPLSNPVKLIAARLNAV